MFMRNIFLKTKEKKETKGIPVNFDESLKFCLLKSLNKKYDLFCHNYYQYEVSNLFWNSALEMGRSTISVTCLYEKKFLQRIHFWKQKYFWMNPHSQNPGDKCDILLQKSASSSSWWAKTPITQEGSFQTVPRVSRVPWKGKGEEERPLFGKNISNINFSFIYFT